MFSQILEKNLDHIKHQKVYRNFDTLLNEVVSTLNKDTMITLSGIKHIGRLWLVTQLLKKTKMQEKCFYFNTELDSLGAVKTAQDISMLLDTFSRIYGIPQIIVLQSVNQIRNIKSLILQIYKSKKFKIIIIDNNIKIDWINNFTLYPLPAIAENIPLSISGGIPQVRMIPDAGYRKFLLEVLRQDIVSREVVDDYSVKHMGNFMQLLHYIAQKESPESLRSLHRGMSQEGMSLTLITMSEYMNAALNTKILERVFRYDLKKNAEVSSSVMHYFGDTGIALSFWASPLHQLRHLLYCELRILWYEVYIWENGRFVFDFYSKKENKSSLAFYFESSQDKNEVRKTARKLAKLDNQIKKFLIVPDKDILNMRKFEEQGVQIWDIWEALLWLRSQ